MDPLRSVLVVLGVALCFLCLFAAAALWGNVLTRLSRLETKSYQDWQTGLPSGRYLRSDLESLQRSSQGLALLVIELRNIERFREFGFREGSDNAIRGAAAVILSCLPRRQDQQRCYRMHDAEAKFAVVLWPVEEPAAGGIASTILSALDRNGTPASIGLVYWSGSRALDGNPPSTTQLNVDELVRMAERFKELARRAGGNCVQQQPAERTAAPDVPIDDQVTAPEEIVAEHDATRRYTPGLAGELRAEMGRAELRPAGAGAHQ